ncbi:protein kinase domain-containing protein [Pseudomonas aeruginosa]|uniref:protein kinase domain-containing protein n=1 Tax=Pseudomonas aeruginosa TaxID=287 RepID=UPI0024C0D58B|nr:serine/threonine protein kinase [Pseudomonas aeruginosa]WHV79582.1 serine/threonine protein kinase [Pseudomonas aeruginosa]
MDKTEWTPPLCDEYGNLHELAEELARGGQGVVFRTKDADLAIKQPLNPQGEPDTNINLRHRFQNIRLLPLPPRIPLSLPLAILRDQPGYVMRLLNDMSPFSVFDLDGKTKKDLEGQQLTLPGWLAGIPDKDLALRLFHYARTGSTRRRLFALSECAAILARLHCSGMVYGDISSNNAFIGAQSNDVWLIDADNLRFEMASGGVSVYTPAYGAPEVVRGTDTSRPRSDCWAFAVMAFKTLALCHPFIGKKVLEPEEGDNGWDSEPDEDGQTADLDEQAYAGYLPFIDDAKDDSNAGVGGLPRKLVATHGLRRLFQETFGAGRLQPHRRPTMAFWAVELKKAFDRSLHCDACTMSYLFDEHTRCPYCDAPRPPFACARTSRGELVIPASTRHFPLPHRLFHPFSFEHNETQAYEVDLDFTASTARPVRGTPAFPDTLNFTFEAGAQ